MTALAVADSFQQEKYLKSLDEAKHDLMELFRSDKWKQLTWESPEKGIVSYQHVKKFGRKVFRLQIIVDLPAKDLWEHMVRTNNESSQWNKAVVTISTLQQINENTVVGHSTAAEALGGLISARDFVNLRQWLEVEPNTYLMQGVGCLHPAMPEQKKYVRGDNGPGGLLYEEVEGNPNQCHVTWIVNADPKGWIPQGIIEKAMKGLMEEYSKSLKQFYKNGIPR